MVVSNIEKNNRLAELRTARGLTQREVAEALGITAVTVNRHENGRTMTADAAKVYADFYDITIAEIFVEPEQKETA